ncbi:actin maturation protease isoform X2 [Rhineura floridana]|uniref:actin maturation protease isoform X2 n=1 Tax=Rhineura floridana TaxID=261503 RepID=UPI002AC81A02|nr:actin maturation protease isoform X2 [Rhineura floridana]
MYRAPEGGPALAPLLAPAPPPLPAPPPPRPCGAQLLKAALEQAGTGDQDGVRELLRRRKASFSEHLKWLLFNNPVPSLIQEGPQCGLVALWMAGALLSLPKAISLERIVQVALERGYTAQGEMFSAANMSRLAEEVLPCQTELLSGGLEGENYGRILQHLSAGFPVLIPYDEDSNHEPCLRNGYKAHWAIASGTLCRSSAWTRGQLPTGYLPGGQGDSGTLPCQPKGLDPPPACRGRDIFALQAGEEWPLPAVEIFSGAGKQQPADGLQSQAGS